MKKIKPQYGKIVPPAVTAKDENEVAKSEETLAESPGREVSRKKTDAGKALAEAGTSIEEKETGAKNQKSVSPLTADPNPFLQTKEVFGKANLTKIGYRMRSDYVEILDIIKKLKKGGYTLEAVLDDALTFYFENSEDGKQALKKAEIFYS